jgi:hypothetical protein
MRVAAKASGTRRAFETEADGVNTSSPFICNQQRKRRNMNTSKLTWAVGIVLVLNLFGAARLRGAELSGPTNAAPKRIGIYDSRAIAVAFAGSASFQEWMKSIKAEHDRARAAGDANRMKQIEADMRGRQTLAHKQAFSTAPVDECLKHVENRMPEIRQKAGVSDIVSKWDAEALKKYSLAEKVDVTMLLVDAFQPNERQRKSAIEIQKHKPITLEEAEKIKD